MSNPAPGGWATAVACLPMRGIMAPGRIIEAGLLLSAGSGDDRLRQASRAGGETPIAAFAKLVILAA
jgi:hypothetical protein